MFPSQEPWHHRTCCAARSPLASPSACGLSPLRSQESSAAGWPSVRMGVCGTQSPGLGGANLRGREGANMGKAFLVTPEPQKSIWCPQGGAGDPSPVASVA